MKYLVIMWAAAAVYLVTGLWIMRRKDSARLSFFLRLSPDQVSDVAAYNKETGKMWCVFSVLLFAGGIVEAYEPSFSILIFAIFSIVGVGGATWWQSRIEKRYLKK